MHWFLSPCSFPSMFPASCALPRHRRLRRSKAGSSAPWLLRGEVTPQTASMSWGLSQPQRGRRGRTAIHSPLSWRTAAIRLRMDAGCRGEGNRMEDGGWTHGGWRMEVEGGGWREGGTRGTKARMRRGGGPCAETAQGLRPQTQASALRSRGEGPPLSAGARARAQKPWHERAKRERVGGGRGWGGGRERSPPEMHAARSTQKESCRVVPNRSGCHHHASDPVFPRPGILLLHPPSNRTFSATHPALAVSPD